MDFQWEKFFKDMLKPLAATAIVAVAVAVSFLQKLGLGWEMIYSISRSFLQLSIIGFVLQFIFAQNNVIWMFAAYLFMENLEHDTIEVQDRSLPSNEQHIGSMNASPAPPLEHPIGYVRGEATNGMPFTITLNEKGQVLNDEAGRTWRDILHREALRLFGPTITRDLRHQEKSKKDELLYHMNKVSTIVPPKEILHSVGEYIKNNRNALRGELIRNKNVVKPHFIGETEWKKLLEQVVIKKKRKSGTLVGKDKYAHTVQASRLSTRHRLGKGGMLSAEAKFLQVFNSKMSEDDKAFASCYGVPSLIYQKIKAGFQPITDYEVIVPDDEREEENEI